MSERFARLLDPARVMALGRYELKGFAEPAEVYSLVASSLSPRK
jgi:class 3 adenylate cyclase